MFILKFEIKRSLIFISILSILILSIGMASASEELSDSILTDAQASDSVAVDVQASESITTDVQVSEDLADDIQTDDVEADDSPALEKKADEKLKKAAIKRTNTKIIYKNMNTTSVVAAYDGRAGEYFNATLVDENNNPMVGKLVQIGFNGVIYNRTTNDTGGVRLQINLANKGDYTFAICYLGDDSYESSFEVALIKVFPKKMSLNVPAKSYKANAKTKSLQATLKDNKGNLIKGKEIAFTVNGKTYTGKTNSKGVATVKVSLSKKKTYNFTAKFEGDKCFGAVTKTGKVTIK